MKTPQSREISLTALFWAGWVFEGWIGAGAGVVSTKFRDLRGKMADTISHAHVGFAAAYGYTVDAGPAGCILMSLVEVCTIHQGVACAVRGRLILPCEEMR